MRHAPAAGADLLRGVGCRAEAMGQAPEAVAVGDQGLSRRGTQDRGAELGDPGQPEFGRRYDELVGRGLETNPPSGAITETGPPQLPATYELF